MPALAHAGLSPCPSACVYHCRRAGSPVCLSVFPPVCLRAGRQAYWQCGGQCGVPAGGRAGFPVRKGRGIFPYLYHFGSSWQHLAPMWKSVAFSGGSAALSRTLTLHPRRQTDASGVCRASVFSFGQLRGTGWPVPCPVGDGRLAFQSVADGFLLAIANSKVSFELLKGFPVTPGNDLAPCGGGLPLRSREACFLPAVCVPEAALVP